jgi:hypothetical protein
MSSANVSHSAHPLDATQAIRLPNEKILRLAIDESNSDIIIETLATNNIIRQGTKP